MSQREHPGLQAPKRRRIITSSDEEEPDAPARPVVEAAGAAKPAKPSAEMAGAVARAPAAAAPAPQKDLGAAMRRKRAPSHLAGTRARCSRRVAGSGGGVNKPVTKGLVKRASVAGRHLPAAMAAHVDGLRPTLQCALPRLRTRTLSSVVRWH